MKTEPYSLLPSRSHHRSTNLPLDRFSAYLDVPQLSELAHKGRAVANRRTKVVNNVVRVNGRTMMHHWRACLKCRGGGRTRPQRFIFQKWVLFLRDAGISLVEALLELTDAASQAFDLRRMLLFHVRRDRSWGGRVLGTNGKPQQRYATVDPRIH